VSDLPEMVSVLCGANGIRISKVTPHGEEVIVPDVLAAAMGVILWARVTGKDLVGWNVFDLSPEAAAIVLRQALGAPLEVLDARQERLERDHTFTLHRMDGMERAIETLKVSPQLNLLVPPRPLSPQ
jgi:hypothetical protein